MGEAEHIKQLFKECEGDPEAKKGETGELLAKCRAGLVDYQANVNTVDILKFATDMKNENEFMNGLQQQLVPWMDKGEQVTNVPLERPTSCWPRWRRRPKGWPGTRLLPSSKLRNSA